MGSVRDMLPSFGLFEAKQIRTYPTALAYGYKHWSDFPYVQDLFQGRGALQMVEKDKDDPHS